MIQGAWKRLIVQFEFIFFTILIQFVCTRKLIIKEIYMWSLMSRTCPSFHCLCFNFKWKELCFICFDLYLCRRWGFCGLSSLWASSLSCLPLSASLLYAVCDYQCVSLICCYCIYVRLCVNACVCLFRQSRKESHFSFSMFLGRCCSP